MQRICSKKIGYAAEDGAVSDSIERRVIKGTKHRGLIRPSSDDSVENVKNSAEPDDEAGQPDMAESERQSARYRAERAHGGQNVGIYSQSDQQ